MLTFQQVFDTVRDHLLRQGARSESINPVGVRNCLYLAPDGKRCAVGCLIEPAAYHEKFEGNGLGSGFLDHALRASGVPIEIGAGPFFLLLEALQKIHDYSSVESWSTLLRETARVHGLRP